MSWMTRRGNVPIILSLREQMEYHRATEVERALKLIKRGNDPKKVVEDISRSLVNKLIHGPINAINEVNLSDRDRIASALESLAKRRD